MTLLARHDSEIAIVVVIVIVMHVWLDNVHNIIVIVMISNLIVWL